MYKNKRNFSGGGKSSQSIIVQGFEWCLRRRGVKRGSGINRKKRVFLERVLI